MGLLQSFSRKRRKRWADKVLGGGGPCKSLTGEHNPGQMRCSQWGHDPHLDKVQICDLVLSKS